MFFEVADCLFAPAEAVLPAPGGRTPNYIAIFQAGSITGPLSSSDVKWTLPAGLGLGEPFASSTDAVFVTRISGVVVHPKESIEVTCYCGRTNVSEDPAAVSRVSILYTTSSDPDPERIPVFAFTSSRMFCNEDWTVTAHKNQPFFTISAKRPAADMNTVPRVVLTVGSYLADDLPATLAVIQCQGSACYELEDDIEDAGAGVPDGDPSCIPCCGTDVPLFPQVGLQAVTWRQLQHGCVSVCAPKAERLPRPLPLSRRTRLGRYGGAGSVPGCPPRKCCEAVTPVDPCVPQAVATLTNYFLAPTAGAAQCSSPTWFFPVARGQDRTPVVVVSAPGFASTVQFALPSPAEAVVHTITAGTSVTMTVFGNQVGWLRKTYVLADYTLKVLVLVWGVGTVNLVTLTTIVSGTSCAGDPYANCNGVTYVRPVLPRVPAFCSAANADLDTGTQPLVMFLLTKDLPVMDLPAGALVYACYTDLMMSGFDVSAFMPVLWRLVSDGGLSLSALVAEDACV
jgi:hypothetical protein